MVFWGIISYWGALHSCQIYKNLSGVISLYEKSVRCSTVALDAANLNGPSRILVRGPWEMELGSKLLAITRNHQTMKMHFLDPFCGARVRNKT